MSIEFPLPRRQTPLGIVSDPKIPIAVRTLAGYRIYRFLLDTGADVSLAPRRLAEEAGLDWDTLPETRVAGVEQGGVRARMGHLSIRLGDIEPTIRCLFMAAPGAPFILGRADFLDRLVLTIDPGQRRIILAALP